MATLRIDPAFARARTAELMAQAQREIPLFHVSRSARVAALQAEATSNGASLTVALLRHVAGWLADFPALNAHWRDGTEQRETVDLGIAWAHRENVLVVPVLADCAAWGSHRFRERMDELKARSAGDAFAPVDFKAPSFTVSNLGALGVETFTSLVTPPQVAVLSVSAVSERLALRDGAVGAEAWLPLTLGIDHRALDGAYAARALAGLVQRIEGGGTR